jgi:hypothetical protein
MSDRNLIGSMWATTTTAARRVSVTWLLVIATGIVVTLSFFDPGIWALSALACGALLGFLFGIPRVQQGRIESVSAPEYRQRVNTNMEEISDWLTKIIVGVGLVQLNQIPSKFESLVRFLAGDKYEPGFVGSVVVFFGVCGFLSAYIFTRVALSRLFSEADRAANEFNDEAKQLPEVPQAQPLTSSALEDSVPIRPEDASPKTVVLSAWASLYGSARSLLARKTSEGAIPKIASTIIDELKSKNLISADQAATFDRLRRMSKLAARSGDEGISRDAAEDFIKSATSLIAHLEAQV